MAVMGVCLIILNGTVFTLLFLMSFAAAFPEQHVDAVEGGSAFLNCLVENQRNVEKLTVEWSKWSKDGVKECVHLYKHRKDQVANQDEKFRGKANLKHEGLKGGIVTLELQFVHLSNSGRYICYIPRLDHHCYIILNIVSAGQNNMTKGENSSTTGPPDEDNQGHLNRNFGRAIVLSIVFLIFSIFIVILIILARRHAAMKSEMKRTKRTSSYDPENQLPEGVSITSELHPRDQH